MSKINAPPLGLQDLLGSQNFGDNPDELARTVFGGVDLIPFLGSTRISYDRATESNTLTLGGGIAPLAVPEGEAWLLLGATGTAVGLQVGQDISIQLAFRKVFPLFPTLEHIVAPMAVRRQVSSSEIFAVHYQPSQAILLQPFTEIAIRLFRVPNVGTVTYEVTAQFIKLTV